MHDKRLWLCLTGVVAVLAAWAPEARAQDFVQSNTYFAVVESNGVLVRSNGAVSSLQLATGRYQVIFKQSLGGCVFNAGLGLTGSSGGGPNGQIDVAKRAGNSKGVFVHTLGSSGGDQDKPFHLIVSCRNAAT